ncbi:MAG: anaerobic carbon-monoxide dehydrogenase catalytic subunit [Nitrospirota bacterium]
MAEGNDKNGGKKSIDPAAIAMLEKAKFEGISTAFTRVDTMKPCPIGSNGACCSLCEMGPCRFVGKNPEEIVGICGATLATIAARNLARDIAGGTAAHSDHGRDAAYTLLSAARGEGDYKIRDVKKLMKLADILGIATTDRTKEEIGLDVANKCISVFGQQEGEFPFLHRAPKKRQEIWRHQGIMPRGVDREIVEMMHRTNMGNDQDPEHILTGVLRVAIADGWLGSLIATDISDILFGTPTPLKSRVNLGVLKEDEVNIIVHGHEPTLSELITEAASDKEMIEYAKSKGANGINLVGICCTSNEILQRQGIPSAGNFLHQELAILTGVCEAMIVDVQCVCEALAPLAKKYHTKLVTTSEKAKIEGGIHMEFNELEGMKIARDIIKLSIDNYPNRDKSRVSIPDESSEVIAGFSHEYLDYMQGGSFRGSFRPLNDAVMAGRIRGVAGIVGCNNPRVPQDEGINFLAQEFIKNDVLVVTTGCSAISCGKMGLLTPETMDQAGPGLKEVCEAIGISPVLSLGSCVDCSRILTVLTQMAEEGGLGDDISDIPAVGFAPEFMCEKALAIGTYFVASGAYVIFGVKSPVSASKKVTEIISKGWEEQVGGQLVFEPDYNKMLELALARIDSKRDALKLKKYEPGKFAKERVLLDMAARRELEKAERQAS